MIRLASEYDTEGISKSSPGSTPSSSEGHIFARWRRRSHEQLDHFCSSLVVSRERICPT